MISFLQSLTEKSRARTEARKKRIAEKLQFIREKRESHREGTASAPNKWSEKVEKLKAERPARMEAAQQKRDEIISKSKLPKSRVFKVVNWFFAPVAAVISILIMETHTWPSDSIRELIRGFGLKGDILVYIPIGLMVMAPLALIASAVTKALERRYGTDPDHFRKP